MVPFPFKIKHGQKTSEQAKAKIYQPKNVSEDVIGNMKNQNENKTFFVCSKKWFDNSRDLKN